MDDCICKNIETQRFKDLSVDKNSGERFFTIYVKYRINYDNIISVE